MDEKVTPNAAQFPVWRSAVERKIVNGEGCWKDRKPSEHELSRGFWSGLSPERFVHQVPCVSTEILPFAPDLLRGQELLVKGDRPAVSGLRMQELFGFGAIFTGLVFFSVCVAQNSFEEERLPVVFGTIGVGIATLSFSQKERQSRAVSATEKEQRWKDQLSNVGQELAVVTPIGRGDQPIGALAIPEGSTELLLTVGGGPIMSLSASKINSVEPILNLDEVYLGGLGNLDGVLLGGLGKFSHLKSCGISILIDDLKSPRLTIELPQEIDCLQWVDRINVLRNRLKNQS